MPEILFSFQVSFKPVSALKNISITKPTFIYFYIFCAYTCVWVPMYMYACRGQRIPWVSLFRGHPHFENLKQGPSLSWNSWSKLDWPAGIYLLLPPQCWIITAYHHTWISPSPLIPLLFQISTQKIPDLNWHFLKYGFCRPKSRLQGKHFTI